MSPCEPRLVDFIGFLVVSLTPLGPSILLPFSTGFLKLCLMFGSGSLHLFPFQLLGEASLMAVMLGS